MEEEPAEFGSSPCALLVSDLSRPVINSLGPVFNLSPEIFEEHLVQSGYTKTSYDDHDSSITWPTRFLPRQHVSLRWHSLVARDKVEPRDMLSRKLLIRNELERRRSAESLSEGTSGPKNRWKKYSLSTLTNIFRKEWSLSASYRAPHRRLRWDANENLVDIGSDDESHEDWDETTPMDTEVVAWEERATFCWGSWKQEKLRK